MLKRKGIVWALLHWLYPTVFTEQTAQQFKDSFDLAVGKYDPLFLDQARRLLELIMLRRLKTDVSKDLDIPPKHVHNIYLPLTTMQQFWYRRLLTKLDTSTLSDLFGRDMKNAISNTATPAESEKSADGTLANASEVLSKEALRQQRALAETESNISFAMNDTSKDATRYRRLLNLVMQLRKCCNHPYLLPNAEPYPIQNGEHVVYASNKLIALDKLLCEIIPKGHKVIVFSQFTKYSSFSLLLCINIPKTR